MTKNDTESMRMQGILQEMHPCRMFFQVLTYIEENTYERDG